MSLNTKFLTLRHLEAMSVVNFANSWCCFYNHTFAPPYVIHIYSHLATSHQQKKINKYIYILLITIIATIKLISKQLQTVMKMGPLCLEQRGTVGACVLSDRLKDDS